MFTWFKAKAAAARMGLRDRGYTEGWDTINEKGNFVCRMMIHKLCNTRLRIGIATDPAYGDAVGMPILYCWLCEIPISPKNIEDPEPHLDEYVQKGRIVTEETKPKEENENPQAQGA